MGLTVHKLTTPITEEQVRNLKVGDTLFVTGRVVTARDRAHKRALEYVKVGKALPITFEGIAIFHCGPIAVKEEKGWRIVAAGPTTSTRMESFEDEFIEKLKPRVIIGKGGMGSRTVQAAKKFGAVYCDFTGGAALLAAERIKRVEGVEWFDLGMPEALWIFEVEDFGPTTVTIDTYGNNLHETIDRDAEQRKREIFKSLGLSATS